MSELSGLLVGLLFWFLLARRFPRRGPSTTLAQAAHVAAVALVPTFAAGAAIYYATTRDWAAGFLPDPIFTVLPVPTAATLSTAFLCVLAAIWACQRKPVEGSSEPEQPVESEPTADSSPS